PLRGADPRTHIGHPALRFLVKFVFILQATHQSSTQSGNLHWVEGKVLILGHLDRNRFKIPEKRGTAEDPTAGTDSAQHLRLVPYADLPEFDPRAEHRGQIPDQFPEIDPAVGGKVEDHL